jgi:hypothetical protein
MRIFDSVGINGSLSFELVHHINEMQIKRRRHAPSTIFAFGHRLQDALGIAVFRMIALRQNTCQEHPDRDW